MHCGNREQAPSFCCACIFGGWVTSCPAMGAAAAFCSSEKIEFHISLRQDGSQSKLAFKLICLAPIAACASFSKPSSESEPSAGREHLF